MQYEETVLYVTAKDVQDAERMGRVLVAKRLAACVNILGGMRSVYRWKGKIEVGHEAVLLVKTTRKAAKRALEMIVELHENEVPCVISFPVVDGHGPFLHWIHAQVGE